MSICNDNVLGIVGLKCDMSPTDGWSGACGGMNERNRDGLIDETKWYQQSSRSFHLTRTPGGGWPLLDSFDTRCVVI